MFKIAFFLLMLTFGTCPLFAQSNVEKVRLKEINSMFFQTEEYLISSNNCKLKEKIDRKAEYEGGELYEYVQRAKRCIFPNELSLKNGEFSGWEWDETITLYEKNDAIYFAIIINNDVSTTSELKAYFNRDGKIFLLLERTLIEPNEIGVDKEISDPQRLEDIEKYIQSKLIEITSMLN